MFVGGGASDIAQQDALNQTRGMMQLEAGIGSSPAHSLVFGGLLRTMTHFSGGTDLAVLGRTASGSFARGDWGLALDLGVYQRWWAVDSTGFIGTLNAGGPWGSQLALSGSVGSAGGQMIALSIGFDWARGTAHRESGQSWWRNHILPLSDARD
jgi:hypothetical protein